MKTLSIKPHSSHIELPVLNRVSAGSPFVWLRKGWDDLVANWALSLGIGTIFAALGAILVDYAWDRPHLVMALTVGFLYVAPFLAIGFYDLSRRRESSGTIKPFEGVRGNGASIGLYAVFLAFALSVWERLSAILVGLFMGSNLPAAGQFSLDLLFSTEHLGFVIPYMIAAGIYAAVVFALSVVTLPVLMDRHVDTVTAMMTSLWVVKENPWPMLVWAVLIGVLTLLGEVLWFVGIAVAFPLLGHATWHAYRELVERPS
jgi:uncharacterized membrane protein